MKNLEQKLKKKIEDLFCETSFHKNLNQILKILYVQFFKINSEGKDSLEEEYFCIQDTVKASFILVKNPEITVVLLIVNLKATPYNNRHIIISRLDLSTLGRAEKNISVQSAH